MIHSFKTTQSFFYGLFRTLLLFGLLLSANVYGAKLPFTGFVSGAAVQVTTPTPVSFSLNEDQFLFLPATSGFVNTAIKNTVWVGVDHSSTVYVSTAYSYRYKLRVETWNNNTVLPQATTDIFLSVKYDPLATTDYRDKSVYSFTGANKVKVSILEIFDYNTSANITNPPDNMIVKSDMEVERYYTFTPTPSICPSHTLADLNGDSYNDQMTISWSMMTGAEEYELEWTYVDDYGTALGTPLAISTIKWNFIGNSTRVTTKNTFYKINLVYDRGYVIYRIRGVGRVIATPNIYVYGNWTKPDNGTNPGAGSCPGSVYNVSAHSSTMNWQYSSTFAEEGKKKEVVGYYDGSLRNRQTVTVNNTDNNAIAGESYYDYQGRKAVDALPVPTGNSALGYNPNFNVNVSLNRYSKLDFDVDGVNACSSAIGPMSNTKGSANYYSSSNPQNTGQNAYIPDAEQFPFSQVEYTPDNTGRIRRMGGVGAKHQLNNKETKYYYGQPIQWELDRLFGSEVGYNSHYKKNMVIDPNGQISISYLDMHGRVVATALSGTSPGNVMALNTDNAVTVTADLLAKNPSGVSLNNIKNAYCTSLTFNTQLLVSSPGNHVLNYALTMPQFTDSCFAASICFDCVYDLNITVRDECGTIVYQTNVTKVGSPVLNTSCGTALVFPSSPAPVTMNLGVGNYQVSKTLTINEEAYNYYLAQYLNTTNNTCFKSLDQLKTEELALLNYDDCDYTCDRCVQLLGSKDEYVVSGKGTEEDWQKAYDICTEPCKELSPCEVLYNAMLTDMSPGGQYAEWFDSTLNAVQIKSFPLSILNYDNVLPDNGTASSSSSASYWRNPKLPDGTVGYFEQDKVTRTKILLQPQTDGTYIPKVTSGTYVYGTSATGFYTYPEYLTNIEDFIGLWQQSWANSLVKYHPEYCYNKWCVENLEGKTTAGALKSYEFDELLNSVETYSDAVTKGLITGSSFDLVNQDPYFTYFNMQSGVNQKTLMNTKCTAYQVYSSTTYTMKEIAALSSKCGSFYGSNFAPACISFGTGTTAELDDMWNAYKAFYISYKQDLIKSAADDYTLTTGCKGFNACIGVKDFNSFAGKANNGSYSTFWASLSEPCSKTTYFLYQTKQRRFLIGDRSLLNASTDQLGFSYFYNTGKCPGEQGMFELLNEMAIKGELTSTHDLSSYKKFTPDLYKMITGSAPGGTCIEYETVATISGSSSEKLRIDFRLKSTSTVYNCAVKFQFISNPFGYTWAQVVGFGEVKLSDKDNISATNTYEMVALVDHDLNPATAPVNFPIKMNTCSSISSCGFYDQCLMSDYSYGLQLLMSALAKGGQLNSAGPVNLETSYPNYITRYIRNEVGGINYTNLRWGYASGVFTLSDPVTTPLATNVTYTINGYSGYIGSFAHSDLGKIKYFENIRIKSSNVQHAFLIDAWYESSPGVLPLLKVTLDITASRGDIALCFDPLPTQCDIPELQAARDLERLLAKILVPAPTVNTPLNGSNLYTSLLESYIGSANYTYLSKPVYTNDKISAYIIAAAGSTPGDQVFNQCKMELYRLNDAYEKINNFSNITALAHLKANELKMVDGKIYYFTIEATFPNGVVETIGGYTSCIPLADCECDKESEPPSCLNLHRATIDLISKYNTGYLNNNPGSLDLEGMPAYANFDCNCGQSYLDYLSAYTNTMVAPLSYTNYVIEICTPKGYFCPEYAVYVKAVQAYNLQHPANLVTIELYTEGFPCACIETYAEYLLTFNSSTPLFSLPPMSLSAFNTAGCTYPGAPADNCAALLPAYTAAYNAKVSAFNAFVMPGGGSLPGAPLPFNTIGIGDCNCLIKYIALLEKYMSNGLNSPAIMATFPAAPSFNAFKATGCDGPCVSEYFIYAETMSQAGISPEPFDQAKCNCYLYYTNYFSQHPPKNGVYFGLTFSEYYDQYCATPLLMGPGGGGGEELLTEGDGETMQKEIILGDTTGMQTQSLLSMEGYTYAQKERNPCCPADTMNMPTVALINGCYDYLENIAELTANLRYQMQVEYFTGRFREKYLDKCLRPLEDLTLQMPNKDYHYTLYYYDQAGNMVRTVPPAGVQLITNSTDLTQVIADRAADDRDIFTTHGLVTTYEYNSLNQLTRQAIPDNALMDRWMVYNNGTSIPSTTTITDTRFIDANVGYMIGNGTLGTEIYRTTDGGRTYNRMTIETSDMNKLQMIDANNGFGVGVGGMFFVTSDAGVNWRLIQVRNGTTPVTETMNDLYFKDASNGILVGENGACYRANLTTGVWSFYPSATSMGTRKLLSVSFSSSTLGYVSVDNAGLSEVYKITTWPTGSTGFTLSSVTIESKTKGVGNYKAYMISSTTGFISGVDGQLMKTTNSGTNWSHIGTGLTTTLRDVYFVDANNGITLGTDGKFYSTKTGGTSWTAISALGYYNAMHFYDKTSSVKAGYAAGDNGVVARLSYDATNGFRVFKLNLYNPTSNKLYTIFGVSSTAFFIGGIDRYLAKVELSGSDWALTNVTTTVTGQVVLKMYFYSSTLGLLICNTGKIYKASYSGSWTYTDLDASSVYYFKDVDYNASTVYLFSNLSGTAKWVTLPASTLNLPFSLLVSNNSGDAGSMTNFHLVSGTSDYVTTGVNGAISTTIGGTLTYVSPNTRPLILRTIRAVAATNTVYAAGDDGTFLKSTDAGVNWQMIVTGTANHFNAMDAPGTSEVYIAGNNGTMVKYTSSSALLSSGTSQHLRSVVKYNSTYVAAGGDNKTLVVSASSGSGFSKVNLPADVLTTASVKGLSANGTNLFLSGKAGIIYTYNGSAYASSYNVTENSNQLRFNTKKSLGIIVGDKSTAVTTANNGQSWQLRPILSTNININLKTAWIFSNTSILVAGNSTWCRLWNSTTNALSTPSGLTATGSVTFKDVSFNAKGKGIMISDESTNNVSYSNSSAASFTLSTLSSATLNSLDIEGPVAYIAGNSNKVYCYDLPSGSTLGSPAISATSATGASNYMKIVLLDRVIAYVIGTNGQVVKMKRMGSGPGTLSFAAEFSNTGSTNTSNTLYATHYNKRGSLVLAGASGYVRTIEDDAQTISNLFWYDELGRLTVSQNTKQFNYATKAYSYTKFDVLARITEVGEVTNSIGPESNLIGSQLQQSGTNTWIGTGTRREVSSIYYDNTFAPGGSPITQINLRKRVASTTFEQTYDGNATTYDHATHYTYDMHGNADLMVQDIPALNTYGSRYKKIKYEYDLISGKTNAVYFNEGEMDQYKHRYTYDAENRITNVETSRDNIQWDNDAKYFYYPHGPLMRTEIGDNKVQGIDFAYTLHGWTKGVNAGILDPNRDMGHDGKTSTINQYVAKDAFGYILGYYAGDHLAINSSGTNHFSPTTTSSDLMNFRYDLYNGNISAMQTALPNCSTYNASKTINSETFGNAYQYDQLNRIKSSRVFTNLNTGTNAWGTTGIVPQNYSTDYVYDANGNITNLTRWGNGTQMDQFAYNYDIQGGKLISNKLYDVDDPTPVGNYTDDIDDQGSFTPATSGNINTANNYSYDEIGNLIKDTKEEIASIEWYAKGKIKKVNRSGGSTKPVLEFTYDASGNRLTKKVTPNSGPVKIYYYLRDAQGNEMARYVQFTSGVDVYFISEEHSIYGASRLGLNTRKDTLYKNTTQSVSYTYVFRQSGMKQYELSNHLGNVLATVTDQKKPNSSGGITIDNFDPVILTLSDYYPFGSTMPGRLYTAASRDYRYGFNGKEIDRGSEGMGGGGSTNDYGFRIYNSNLGKFLSVDPLSFQYPWNSTYAFAENDVMQCIDLEGLERWVSTTNGTLVNGPFSLEYAKKQGYSATLLPANYEDINKIITYFVFSSPTLSAIMDLNKSNPMPMGINFGINTATYNLLTPDGELGGVIISITKEKNDNPYTLLNKIAFEMVNANKAVETQKLRDEVKERGRKGTGIAKKDYIMGILRLEADAKLKERMIRYETGQGGMTQKEYETLKTDQGFKDNVERMAEHDYNKGYRKVDGNTRTSQDVYGEQYDNLIKEGEEQKKNGE